MPHGQNRGKQKTLIKQKSQLNENRGIYKFCGNRVEYAICIIGLGLRGWTSLGVSTNGQRWQKGDRKIAAGKKKERKL